MRDLTGQQFRRLTAIKPNGKDKHNNVRWLCQCTCGNTITTTGLSLVAGDTKSCGCLNMENLKSGNNRRTHGEQKTRLYRIWKRIRTRCSNPNTEDYQKWYGAKGIRVCPEWDDYIAFRNWALSNGYRDDLTIDRFDPEKDYCPENCRWATRTMQSRNRSHNVLLTHNGETHCISEWAEILGVKPQTLEQRYFRGWDTHRILTQPVRGR